MGYALRLAAETAVITGICAAASYGYLQTRGHSYSEPLFAVAAFTAPFAFVCIVATVGGTVSDIVDYFYQHTRASRARIK